jgi:hypothetical protein
MAYSPKKDTRFEKEVAQGKRDGKALVNNHMRVRVASTLKGKSRLVGNPNDDAFHGTAPYTPALED